MRQKKILSIFGTRPEAIKMAPIIKKMEDEPTILSKVIVTGQHREMLDQILTLFSIKPDYDLNIMKKSQSLEEITCKILTDLSPILQKEEPDLILVHGDTTTTFAASLAAIYQKIPIGHVEAGLRTHNKFSPFPEEINRNLTDTLSDLYFAPTELSRDNLLREGVDPQKITVTGNTSIDTVYALVDQSKSPKIGNTKNILFTMHRRENWGAPMDEVFSAIKQLAENYPDISITFPVHKNPDIRTKAHAILGNQKNIYLIEPLDVFDFYKLVQKSYFILTDSGGIQEEAPALNIPVLVLRDSTERPEGVSAGTLRLVGTRSDNVYKEAERLILNEELYVQMANADNPYGDGKASERIIMTIKTFLNSTK